MRNAENSFRRDLIGGEAVRRELIGDLGQKPNSGKLPETVNAETLGDLLGISARMVADYTSRGVMVRRSQGQYALRDSVRGYIKLIHKRPDADTLTQQRVRQTKEAADQLALKNAKLKGELLPAAEVEQQWASILRDLRAALLAMPSRVQQSMGHLTVSDIAAIDREVRDILTELGEGNGSRSS